MTWGSVRTDERVARAATLVALLVDEAGPLPRDGKCVRTHRGAEAVYAAGISSANPFFALAPLDGTLVRGWQGKVRRAAW